MFNKLNWIPFSIETYVQIFYPYKRLEGTTPDYINSISNTNSEIHNRLTHFLNLNFHFPLFKKNIEGGWTFSMKTIRNWKNCTITLYYLFPTSKHNFIDTMI